MQPCIRASQNQEPKIERSAVGGPVQKLAYVNVTKRENEHA